MHPTRKRNRTRGQRLAAAPVAFRGSDDAHRIDARDRMRPLAAVAGWSTRTLENLDAIARYENRPDRDEAYPTLPRERVTFRGVDSLGRRNPRVGETQYGRV